MRQNCRDRNVSGRLFLAFISIGSALLHSLYGAVPARPAGQLLSWGGTVIPPISAEARFAAVATGDAHTVVVNLDGTVTGWGSSSALSPTLSNVVAIAAGGGDTIALRADGTVVGWGVNRGRFAAVLSGWTGVKQVSMSQLRAVGLREDGTVLEWVSRSPGVNAVPKPENLSNVIAVAAGGRHSLALLMNGNVIGWGYNQTSQAVPPENVTNVVAVAAGEHYSMALRGDRTLIGWGNIDFVFSNVVQIAAGLFEATVLQSDGKLIQVSVGARRTSLVSDVSAVKQIAAGDGFHQILYTNGTLAGFGTNHYLQASVPRNFAEVVEVASHRGIFDDEERFIAVRADGTVFEWGTLRSGSMTAPAGLQDIVSVAAGEYFSLALRKDGTVAGWGNPENNRLNIPANLTNAVQISARGWHSLALREDGTVSAWGSDASGQSTVPADLGNVVAVACGVSHSMALSANGTVRCWGSNLRGQCDVPEGLSNVIAIAAGDHHNLALRGDGTVAAWGENSRWQATVPGGLARVVKIGAGRDHSFACLGDGSIVAWGNTNRLPLPSGSTNRNILWLASSLTETAAVVQNQPRIRAELRSGQLNLSFWTFSGKRYELEHATEQPATKWSEPTRSIEGKWGWASVADPNIAGPKGFYRLRVVEEEVRE